MLRTWSAEAALASRAVSRDRQEQTHPVQNQADKLHPAWSHRHTREVSCQGESPFQQLRNGSIERQSPIKPRKRRGQLLPEATGDVCECVRRLLDLHQA